MFSISKQHKSYVLAINGVETPLTLCSSVALYRAAIFKQYIKWQVQDDSAFVKQLIEGAIKNPCLETFKPLFTQEEYYRELNGACSDNTPDATRSEIVRNNYVNRVDLMSSGLRLEGGTKRLTELDAVSQLAPLSSWVDQARANRGYARNKWRTTNK